MTIKFGTFLLMQSPSARPSTEMYARAIDMAQVAENLGFRREGEFLFRADRHDAAAKEVDRDTFFRIRESGGTVISSAYETVIRILVPRGDDPPYAVDDSKIYVRSEAETGLAVRDEIVGLVLRGRGAQPAGIQRCGSNSSMSRALCVGSRVSTSLRYAYGSCPLSLADWIRLMMAAARLPARRLPANSQFFRPVAMGRMRFSIQLLSIGRSPSPMNRTSAAQRLRL